MKSQMKVPNEISHERALIMKEALNKCNLMNEISIEIAQGNYEKRNENTPNS